MACNDCDDDEEVSIAERASENLLRILFWPVGKLMNSACYQKKFPGNGFGAIIGHFLIGTAAFFTFWACVIAAIASVVFIVTGTGL